MEKLLVPVLLLFHAAICLSKESSFCSIAPVVSLGFINCQYCECCEKPWINFDISGLEKELMDSLYGQHIVQSAVIRALRGFLNNPDPGKALAMSFNGLTGSGKTFLSRLIIKHLYKRNRDSGFVHIYVANRDFPHKTKVSQYQDRLQEEIIRYTKKCHRSLFIFEEVEKMPPGTIDAIKPFLDYHDSIDGVDFRKNIFIFLSNSGSSEITGKALEFWANGKDREDICMEDIDPLILKGSFNEKGGFQYSELLSSSLIDVFVPFLPLEKQHVKRCIEAELDKRNEAKSPELINKVSNSLLYFPEESNLFSQFGCKQITNKVNLFKK